MKKNILTAIALTTMVLAAGVMASGGAPLPLLILGGFVFLLVLGLMNPPAKRNLSHKEKQDSLMRSLGVDTPPDGDELMPDEEEGGNGGPSEDKD